jgi:hypothetical protein
LQQILTFKHKLLTANTCRRWTLEEHHVDEQNENGWSTWRPISDGVHWKQYNDQSFNQSTNMALYEDSSLLCQDPEDEDTAII